LIKTNFDKIAESNNKPYPTNFIKIPVKMIGTLEGIYREIMIKCKGEVVHVL
jgi:hypothetical protein